MVERRLGTLWTTDPIGSRSLCPARAAAYIKNKSSGFALPLDSQLVDLRIYLEKELLDHGYCIDKDNSIEKIRSDLNNSVSDVLDKLLKARDVPSGIKEIESAKNALDALQRRIGKATGKIDDLGNLVNHKVLCEKAFDCLLKLYQEMGKLQKIKKGRGTLALASCEKAMNEMNSNIKVYREALKKEGGSQAKHLLSMVVLYHEKITNICREKGNVAENKSSSQVMSSSVSLAPHSSLFGAPHTHTTGPVLPPSGPGVQTPPLGNPGTGVTQPQGEITPVSGVGTVKLFSTGGA